MDNMGFSTLILMFLYVGAVRCQIPLPSNPVEDKTSLPLCKFEALNPCITLAIRSYIRNTKGDLASKLPPDSESSMAVGAALTADFNSPTFNGTAICRTISKIDMGPMAQCFEEVTADCTMDMTEEDTELFSVTIPSARISTMTTAISRMSMLCIPACLSSIQTRMAALKVCWKASEAAVEALLKGSPPDCKPIADYMQCQWNVSIGCKFTEALTRDHLVTLNGTIAQCGVVLPAEALVEPVKLTTSGSTSINLQFIHVVCSILMAVAVLCWITNAAF